MAKMFYSIEEAAERLGVNQDQLKQMAASGKLQQFRDRDKLMFKRDQVDAMAQKGGTAGGSASGLTAAGASGGPIPLSPSGETDAIDLKADSHRGTTRKDDPRQATGISVFDAGEVPHTDPMAQTQVTPSVRDEDLAIESVGSGSGLLDLTRESDDTSLGAELLDEIYPGSGGEASDAKVDVSIGSGVSAVAEAGSSSGLEEIGSQSMPMVSMHAEVYDPGGSGLSVGMLLGATITLILLLIVTMYALMGVPASITAAMTESGDKLIMYSGALLLGSVVLGVVGFFIGKATAK
jgi:excisionase family DNA binding protein